MFNMTVLASSAARSKAGELVTYGSAAEQRKARIEALVQNVAAKERQARHARLVMFLWVVVLFVVVATAAALIVMNRADHFIMYAGVTLAVMGLLLLIMWLVERAKQARIMAYT